MFFKAKPEASSPKKRHHYIHRRIAKQAVHTKRWFPILRTSLFLLGISTVVLFFQTNILETGLERVSLSVNALLKTVNEHEEKLFNLGKRADGLEARIKTIEANSWRTNQRLQIIESSVDYMHNDVSRLKEREYAENASIWGNGLLEKGARFVVNTLTGNILTNEQLPSNARLAMAIMGKSIIMYEVGNVNPDTQEIPLVALALRLRSEGYNNPLANENQLINKVGAEWNHNKHKTWDAILSSIGIKKRPSKEDIAKADNATKVAINVSNLNPQSYWGQWALKNKITDFANPSTDYPWLYFKPPDYYSNLPFIRYLYPCAAKSMKAKCETDKGQLGLLKSCPCPKKHVNCKCELANVQHHFWVGSNPDYFKEPKIFAANPFGKKKKVS